jgi:putative transposase
LASREHFWQVDMGRQLRVEYAGAVYHVMCRGNRRKTIFQSDEDRKLFLRTLGEACARTGWRVCAFVLMSKHYHMILETPEANLVDGMKWFQGTYTKRHNARNKGWGHVYQGRYKSVVIDLGDAGYFRTACDYVHLNPARAHLTGLDAGVRLRDYIWSSSWYLSTPPAKEPDWLTLGRIVQAHTADRDCPRTREDYLSYLETRAEEKPTEGESLDDEYKQLRRGWCHGSDDFKIVLKESIGGHIGQLSRDSIIGEPRRMHDMSEAEILLLKACDIVGLNLDEKDVLRKNDVRKEMIAWFLQKKTSVGQEWVAAQLGMGSRANVSRALMKLEQTREASALEYKQRLEDMFICLH